MEAVMFSKIAGEGPGEASNSLTQPSEALIRLPEVLRRTALTRATLYRLAARNEFPRPVKLSERCSAWPESKVAAWIAARTSAV